MKMSLHLLEDFQTGSYNNFTFWQRPSWWRNLWKQ